MVHIPEQHRNYPLLRLHKHKHQNWNSQVCLYRLHASIVLISVPAFYSWPSARHKLQDTSSIQRTPRLLVHAELLLAPDMILTLRSPVRNILIS